MRGFGYLKQVTFFVVKWLLVAPLRFIYQLMKPAACLLYEQYLPIKQRLRKHFPRLRRSWFYPLTTRYIVHFVIVILTIFVTTNSLGAREIRTEDFGENSIMASLVGRDTDEEIIETAESLSIQTDYTDSRGVLHLATTSPVETVEEETFLATSAGGTSLVKTSSPTTTYDPDRQGVAEYTVLGGDTVSTIAEQFNISSSTILWANDLGDNTYIKPGQVLKIPPVSGVIHTVKSGDTVSSIASKYSADSDTILKQNKLADASAIEVGQTLIVPGGKITPPPPAPTPTRSYGGSIYGGTAPPSARVASGDRLGWPTVSRKILQWFNGYHTGIDIKGDYSTPIYASAPGKVIKSQGGWNGGYGNYVIIDHGNGMQTLYAHASKLYVSVGDYVTAGQSIAMVGTTGRSTGTHLHFEIRVGGRRLNPLNYL
ncbi:MAG: peptidoglycan DD-metalloendopeptidase family protein [Patescibacteria group bacterium]